MASGDCGHNGASFLSRHLAFVAALLAVVLCEGVSATDEGDSKPAAEEPPRERPFDPLAGMDPSGRIPKAPLPEGIRNPERWRYIPEGRLLEGNVFERFLVSSFIAPIVFFESDVGFGGGVSITDIDFRTGRRQEFAGIFLTYTSEGQQRYSMVWRRWLYHQDLPEGGVIQEERTFVRLRAGYSKSLTRRFFGLGADTAEEDETSYTDEVIGAAGSLQISVPRPGDDIVLRFGMAYDHHNLGSGFAGGAPDTEDIFPALFQPGDDRDLFWIHAGLRYDTRDSQANPYEGWAAGVTLDASPLQTDFDVGARWGMFATGVLEVPGIFHDGGDDREENPPTDVLAASAFLVDTAGELPFYELPSLGGGNTLRGYIGNRWTGESAWHAALEYRLSVIPRGFRITDTIRVERIGLAPFVEAGSVADSVEDLFNARVHPSYGIGLRVGLERTAIFRADFGFSNEGINFTFRFGLSF